MRLSGRSGPLAERNFRLLFAGTTITTLGDTIGKLALAFAVLDLPGGSATELGIVLATSTVVQTVVLVFGAVLSDRLPRNVVLTGASLVQGAAQGVAAALVLSGEATVPLLVVLAAVYGFGGGFVLPAEIGLVPQTVSPERLQQANALQGMSRNIVSIAGPAIGGALVVAGSTGVGLAVDSASFVVCAVVLWRISVPGREGRKAGFFHELREGWQEFTRHTWLWSSVLLFGVSNLVWSGCTAVLGPVIAKQEWGGAGAWAALLAAGGLGAVFGGLVALRYRPRRPLLAACLVSWPLMLQLLVLALYAPVWIVAVTSFLTGAGIALHLALWFTVFQREVPEHAQSRVSSYDALGSFVLVPLGMAIVGPVSDTLGIQQTILIGLAISLVCQLAIVAIPSVRNMRARDALAVEPEAA